MLQCRGLLLVARPSPPLLSSYRRDTSGAQVLGASVPSFAHFPFKYREILYLYKEFLKIIYYYHPPEERRDLLFRVRNEFQSKRHLTGRKVVSAAVRRGEGVLALQKQILERNEMRRRRQQVSGGGGAAAGGGGPSGPVAGATMEQQLRAWKAGQDLSSANSTTTSTTTTSATGNALGADSVDALWEQLQHVSNSVVPGLNNSRSVGISGSGYAGEATKNVYSRRR